MFDIDVQWKRNNFELRAAFSAAYGITALFGPSGAGKSTLIHLIAGLQKPDKGRISVNGKILFDDAHGINLAIRKRRIGVVFQEPGLFPHFSVAQNLTYACWAGFRSGGITLDESVRILGLEPLLRYRPHQLSGGEKQRVAIGRALLSNPDILLMDEPLSSLDMRKKEEILPFIERIRDEIAIPMIYVSHAMDEVARLANFLVVLNHGSVVAHGDLATVLAQQNVGTLTGMRITGSILDAQVCGYNDLYDLLELEVEGQRIQVISDRLAVGCLVRLRIRARDVILSRSPPQNMSVRNNLNGKITDIIVHESDPIAEIILALGKQTLRVGLTRLALDEMGLKTGDLCFALVKTIALDKNMILRSYK